MGVASFETAGLKFRSAVYDTLESSGRATTFRILGAESSGPRKVGRKDSRYVTHVGYQAIQLTTDKGGIEVAGRPESLRNILNAASGSRSRMRLAIAT